VRTRGDGGKHGFFEVMLALTKGLCSTVFPDAELCGTRRVEDS
jgi:hypothetical protein